MVGVCSFSNVGMLQPVWLYLSITGLPQQYVKTSVARDKHWKRAMKLLIQTQLRNLVAFFAVQMLSLQDESIGMNLTNHPLFSTTAEQLQFEDFAAEVDIDNKVAKSNSKFWIKLQRLVGRKPNHRELVLPEWNNFQQHLELFTKIPSQKFFLGQYFNPIQVEFNDSLRFIE